MLFKTSPRFWEKSSFSQSPIRAIVDRFVSVVLLPFAWIFGLMVWIKQLIVDSSLLHTLGIYRAAPVPIIIVGNIRVGGTGKTPLVIALANELVERGFKPGVISRGYQPNARSLLAQPTAVNRNGNPNEVGDEPVLMSQCIHDSVPIWVYSKRKACIDALLQAHSEVNVIISDDGLQHAALVRWPAREGGRDLELVVEDERGDGNGRLLPAGPLRESAKRERDATITISQLPPKSEPFSSSHELHFSPIIDSAYPLHRPNEPITFTQMLSRLVGLKVGVLAAIGNPKKFFDALVKLGVHIDQTLALPDHASVRDNDLQALAVDLILITEKDAVKCSDIEDSRVWVIPMRLDLPSEFSDWVQEVITRPNPYLK
ncbi:tetraacyldisaccharide 4'-kinase [Polynucleobacter sp. MWH-UH24A]|uniref:tetraacyldisaccharide 4'-kinase n=1 Tax=Polynucleobacter sp. MWH-UH24A TaxID=2689110 RepID=UPI001BFE0BA0|nr:tetraacyldisaccharide 4'-kinase [Polynucleobacter sp. MWH-UH24A]QWD76363.1 tetraacyldisaccharide 4'-kinase [Polynucleobacter sp. MWH-UH24A]